MRLNFTALSFFSGVAILAFKSKKYRFWLLSGLLALSTLASAQTRLYVTTQGANSDPASATSWQTATADLQGAINALASAGGEVWVAQGTYKTTTDTDRNVSFSMKNGVKIYGGFLGSETNLSNRPTLNLSTPSSTTLSGDIGTPNDASDNAYHVILNNSLDTTALLDGVVITGGNADGSTANGGGMFNVFSNPILNNCHFIFNMATNGGAMNNISSSPSLTNCSFTSNKANAGGGIQSSGNITPILTDCSFTSNTASQGGGMFNITTSPVLTNCSFTSNTADTGGGILNSNSNPTLTNCSFTNNKATTYGGGIHNIFSTPILTDCSFTDNTATNGGGINNSNSNPTLTDCGFTSNTATYGGGMYNIGSNPRLDSCRFTSNTATEDGGGMFNSGSTNPSFTYCTFTSNTAANGGAIYNISASALVDNCTFKLNTASDLGGGIMNFSSSSPTLTNCSFTSNTASQGGGIMNQYASTPSLTSCSFTSNTATWGGGISNISSSPIFTHCSFTSNMATYGGIMDNYYSNPSLTNCSLRGNTASYGGGIYNESSSPGLTNCSLTGNTATVNGGAIYLFNFSSTPTLTNCILWGNGNLPVFSVIENLLTANYCLFDPHVTGNTGANNLISETSPFLSETDLQLTMCSQAVNAGDPTSATALSGPYSTMALPQTDLAGNPRIHGSRVDIGAYEFQAEPGSITVTAFAASTSSCVGQPISLSATVITTGAPVTYHWAAPAGAQISETTTNPTSATLLTGGPQTFTVTATSLGCSATATVSVTGIDQPSPNLTSTTVTQGTALLLTASNCAGTLSWNGPGGTSGAGSITVSTATLGSFAYQATCQANGCISEPAHFTITVTAPPTTVTGSFEGYIYGADCQTFRGWVWDRNKANTPITVDLLEGDQLLATLPADVFRQDLLDAGKGNGRHAFVWTIPDHLKDGQPHSLSARVTGNSFVLKNSPKSILCQASPTPGNQPPNAPTPTSLIKPLSAQVAIPFQVTLPPFSDPESQTLAYGQSGLPAGLSLNPQTRIISGTPTQSGEFVITYTATDPQGATNSVSFLLTVNPAVAVTGNFEGFLDKVECGTIRGWVWDRNQPNSPVTVEFYTGSTVWGSTLADIYRVDLKNAGKGNGAHAYSFTVPQTLKGTGTNLIYARVQGSSYVLKESGKPLNCPDAGRRSAEAAGELQVLVLGNPIGEIVRLEIRGAQGQGLQLQLTDVQGRLVSEQQVEKAAEIEQQTLSTKQTAPGLLVLRVSSGSRSVILKLLKP